MRQWVTRGSVAACALFLVIGFILLDRVPRHDQPDATSESDQGYESQELPVERSVRGVTDDRSVENFLLPNEEQAALSSASHQSLLVEQDALRDAFTDHEHLLDYFSNSVSTARKRSAEAQAFEWFIELCHGVIELSHSDVNEFVRIQTDPNKIYFYLKMLDYCLGGLDDWPSVQLALGRDLTQEMPMIGGDFSDRSEFLAAYGRRAFLENAADQVASAESLADLINGFHALQLGGYIFSGEAGPELPVFETMTDRSSMTWIVPMLYACQLGGGCGRDHPFTMHHCIWNHCDEHVTDYSSAIYRTLPRFQVEAIGDLYKFLVKLRRQGSAAIEVDPEVSSLIGR